MSQALKIHHDLGEVVLKPSGKVNPVRLRKMIRDTLDQYLEEDLSFKIYLKGYASPLASAEYNEALGARRIKTIQNEFAAYKGGVLQKYFDSGDLEVTEKSFGEGTAPPGVSDDARDKRSSIYSPAASRERRVEIIEIQKDNPDEQ